MSDKEFIEALRASAAEFLDDQCPIARVHRHGDSNDFFAADLWQKAVELGWTMIAVPEAHGGMGGGIENLTILQEALGAHLAPVPYLGTTLLQLALKQWPKTRLSGKLLSGLACGEFVGGVADMVMAPPLSLDQGEGALALNGDTIVIDGIAADWLLVAIESRQTGKKGLAIVPSDAAGLVTVARPIADRTRSLATLQCRQTPVKIEQVFCSAKAEESVAHLVQSAALLLASDAVGGADSILAASVEYLKTRVQFGKPIGSFQAIKHRAADLKVSLEMSRGLVATAIDKAGTDDGATWAFMAKASASETYLAIASEAVQMHGGIGFTWEHQAHLHLKRATLNRTLFGNTATLQDQVAKQLVGRVAR